MAKHTTLKKTLRQMATGSKSAFRSFYLGTSQYIYSSALLLYDSHEDACRVDVYQYLFLHLPEYNQSEDPEHWISRLIMERFEQLSIGKHLSKPSVRQQMSSTATPLSKNEQERVWRMLDANIHFPKETAAPSPMHIALLVSVLLLLLLIASRYAPAALRQLQTLSSTDTDSGNISREAGESDTDSEDSDSNDVSEEPEDTQTDQLNSIADELEDLLNERTNTETDSGTDDSDSLQLSQPSEDSTDSDQTQTPATPTEPDTPKAPDPPKEHQTPSLSDDSGSGSASQNLDDLELQLHYGDSLLYSDSN